MTCGAVGMARGRRQESAQTACRLNCRALPAPPTGRVADMTVMLQTGLHPLALVRLLAGPPAPPAGAAPPSFAERLSPWLGWADAIALAGVLAEAGGGAAPVAPRRGAAGAAARLVQQVHALQAERADAIRQDPTFTAPGADALACKGPYLAHQQILAARIGPLRAQLRAALAGAHPGGSRLAALDAVLEQALAGRERALLAGVPPLLFGRAEGGPRAADAAAGSGPVAPVPAAERSAAAEDATVAEATVVAADPGAYGRHVQQVLLAELELRMQPLLGLAAALAPQDRLAA